MDLSPRQRVSVSLSRRHLEEKLPGSRIVGCEASLDAWKAFTLRNPKHGHSLTSVSLDTSIRPSQRIMPNALFIIVVAGPWVRSFSDCSFCLRCQRCYAIWAGNRTVHTQWNQTLQHIAPERNQSSPRPGPGGEKTNVHTAMTTPDRGNDHSVQAQYNGSAHSLVQLVVWALDMECCGMWSLVVELYLMSTIFFCRTASLAAFTSHSLPQGGAEHDLCFTNPELLRFRRAATEPLKSRPQLLAICTIDR